jgi:t-SNARE complex subunit (syntaxin)
MRYICFVTENLIMDICLKLDEQSRDTDTIHRTKKRKQTENLEQDYLRIISERRDLIYID